jgi:hypothetical protein
MRAFFGEQHPDGPDIRTGVETVEDDPSHLVPFAWISRDRGFDAAKLLWSPPQNGFTEDYLSSARGSFSG